MKNTNAKVATENANYITDYPMGRDLDLIDNLVDACAEDIMNSWWEGNCWDGTLDIAYTLGGVYRARVEYRTNETLAATILGPNDAEIGYREFLIDCDGTFYAFDDMCNWIDGKLDEIEKNNR